MKLVRYGQPGQEKPGLVDASGAIRDLSGVIPDIDGAAFASGALARLKGLDPASLPAVPAGTRLHPTLRRDAVRKLLADDTDQLVWLYPGAGGGFEEQAPGAGELGAGEDRASEPGGGEHIGEHIHARGLGPHGDRHASTCRSLKTNRPRSAQELCLRVRGRR